MCTLGDVDLAARRPTYPRVLSSLIDPTKESFACRRHGLRGLTERTCTIKMIYGTVTPMLLIIEVN